MRIDHGKAARYYERPVMTCPWCPFKGCPDCPHPGGDT